MLFRSCDIVFGVVLSLFCGQVSVESTENATILSTIISSSNKFAADIYKVMAEENENGNLILSPSSAHIVLTMLAYGAIGHTAEQINRALHLSANKDNILLGYYLLQRQFENIKGVRLHVANRVYVSDRKIINPNYTKMIDRGFRSGIGELGKDTSKAVQKVNDWVRKETNNAIDEILKEGNIDVKDLIVVLNAVYFAAKWKLGFPKENTRHEQFFTSNDNYMSVPMMSVEGHFVYGTSDRLDAKYIEIPYCNEALKMVVIVPNKISGLSRLGLLLESDDFDDEFSKFGKHKVELNLPKFRIESQTDLQSALQSLGMTDAFSSTADFSGMSNERVSVSRIVQRAIIEVDETGTKAAAATMYARFSRSTSIVLNVDRPFYFSIKYGDLTLFQGHVVNPMKG